MMHHGCQEESYCRASCLLEDRLAPCSAVHNGVLDLCAVRSPQAGRDEAGSSPGLGVKEGRWHPFQTQRRYWRVVTRQRGSACPPGERWHAVSWLAPCARGCGQSIRRICYSRKARRTSMSKNLGRWIILVAVTTLLVALLIAGQGLAQPGLTPIERTGRVPLL